MFKSIYRSLKRSFIGEYMRSRHLFCVGLPKAGTESVARLFGRRFRAAHEPRYRETIDLACAFENASVTHADVVAALIDRDRDMRLDMEASHLLARFAPILVDVFPRARFIMTIREPRSWLDSEINQCINYPRSNPARGFEPWIRLRDLCYGPVPTVRSAEEQSLSQYDLHSLDGMLSYWRRHISTVLSAVPADRLLVVRVEELSRSVEPIARFAGVAPRALATEFSHTHKAPVRHNVLAAIPAAYLEAKIAQHCGELTRQYYGR